MSDFAKAVALVLLSVVCNALVSFFANRSRKNTNTLENGKSKNVRFETEIGYLKQDIENIQRSIKELYDRTDRIPVIERDLALFRDECEKKHKGK